MVSNPTRCDSIFDLFFSSDPDCIFACHTLEYISNHNAVLIESTFSASQRNIIRKTFLNYSKVDSNQLLRSFDPFSSEFRHLFNTGSVADNWVVLKDKIHCLIKEYVPSASIKRSVTSPSLNNYFAKISQTKKKGLFTTAKTRNTPESWVKYNASAKTFKLEIKTSKSMFLNRDLSHLSLTDPRKF